LGTSATSAAAIKALTRFHWGTAQACGDALWGGTPYAGSLCADGFAAPLLDAAPLPDVLPAAASAELMPQQSTMVLPAAVPAAQLISERLTPMGDVQCVPGCAICEDVEEPVRAVRAAIPRAICGKKVFRMVTGRLHVHNNIAALGRPLRANSSNCH
jgi:hypothetical protein